MKSEIYLVCTLAIFIFKSMSAQQEPRVVVNDSIVGNVKSVKEKVIFINPKIQNAALWGDRDPDYGHYGFISPSSARAVMQGRWYNSEMTGYINNIRNYSTDGLLIADLWLDKTEQIFERYEYRYDSSSNKKTVNIYEYDTYQTVYDSLGFWQGKQPVKATLSDSTIVHYSYNHNGNLIQKTEFDSSGYDSIETYAYDFDNKLYSKSNIELRPTDDFRKSGNQYSSYETTIFLRSDSLRKVVTIEMRGNSYTKDYKIEHLRNGNVYKSEYLIPTKVDKNELRTLFTQKFDNNGSILERVQFERVRDVDDKVYINNIKNYKYLNGNMIESSFKTGDSKSYSAYKYDVQDRIIEEKNYYLNKIRRSKSFAYFKDSNRLKSIDLYYYELESDVQKSEVVFKYKFDEKGNWTQQIKTVNGKDSFIWSREIEYYE